METTKCFCLDAGSHTVLKIILCSVPSIRNKILSVDGNTTDAHPGDSFVDDTHMGATDDNYHLEPIPASGSELSPEEENIVTRMEDIILFSSTCYQ
jgi:hypothetical protein